MLSISRGVRGKVGGDTVTTTGGLEGVSPSGSEGGKGGKGVNEGSMESVMTE